MSLLVTATGTAMCSMGTAPAPIKVTSQTKALAGGKPCATVQDAQPMANVDLSGCVHPWQILRLQLQQQQRWEFLLPSRAYRHLPECGYQLSPRF